MIGLLASNTFMPCQSGTSAREAALLVDRHDDLDAVLRAHALVVLAEARRHVDDARALGRVDEVAAEHA